MYEQIDPGPKCSALLLMYSAYTHYSNCKYESIVNTNSDNGGAVLKGVTHIVVVSPTALLRPRSAGN